MVRFRFRPGGDLNARTKYNVPFDIRGTRKKERGNGQRRKEKGGAGVILRPSANI